jgi:hypothetical protein
MSATNPALPIIKRWSVVGMEGMWTKMFDPPNDSPATPDLVTPTNPVPEVLTAANIQRAPRDPHTVEINLMHGVDIDSWDNRKGKLHFFLFDNPDINSANGNEYPSPTLRMPRGVVFHCNTSGGGPAPHTIHWHGLEPTTINDGVGHCSMEIGSYVYQWQPQYIGTYFAHCHRNTVQHFEFGLYFLVLIEPPDAYFATQVLGNTIPIGHCRDGKRRTAANLSNFLQFPDYNPNHLYTPDPWAGAPALKFPTDPHANTVAYDVEALWVCDDRDSAWSDLAKNAHQTYPAHGARPGFDDNFHGHAGALVNPGDFFAFNDFNADYWFITGVPVKTGKGGSDLIPANLTIPDYLNSGVFGSQISINALTGQTILVRCLDAAYNSLEVTFPVDVVIIAWDGRALGVAPFGHNHAYLVPAHTPIKQTTARRFDALIRETTPINSFATVKFINNRGQIPGTADDVVCTARIPITIAANPGLTTYALSGLIASEHGDTLLGVSVDVAPLDRGASAAETVLTDINGNFNLTGLVNGSYTVTPSMPGYAFTPKVSTVVISNNNQSINFSIDPEVRINNIATNLLTLQAAYDAAGSGDVIKLRAGTLIGDLLGSLPKSGIIIKGGYNADFSAQVDTTVIRGNVTVKSGSIKMDNVKLR